jgi:hypothetical protein
LHLYLILRKSQHMTEKSACPGMFVLREINQGAIDREEK